MSAPAVAEVTARPYKSARISIAVAAIVVIAFAICAVILPRTTDGVTFTAADQVGIFGCGVLVAIGILCFTRPRVRAGASGVDTRSFFGGYRHVGWGLVTAVEFPPKGRFARLVLPGDELITLYAVQRGDAERSVVIMRQLRALHAAHSERDARG